MTILGAWEHVFPTSLHGIRMPLDAESHSENQYWMYRASLRAHLVRIHLQCRRPRSNSLVGKIPWRRERLPTPVFLGFPCGSAGKESASNVRDLSSIPGLGISPGEGNGYPLQCSGLEKSIDCIVQRVAKSQTLLSDFHFTNSVYSKYYSRASQVALVVKNLVKVAQVKNLPANAGDLRGTG